MIEYYNLKDLTIVMNEQMRKRMIDQVNDLWMKQGNEMVLFQSASEFTTIMDEVNFHISTHNTCFPLSSVGVRWICKNRGLVYISLTMIAFSNCVVPLPINLTAW
jgi:hypothetical protein